MNNKVDEKIQQLLSKLTIEEKAELCVGAGYWNTKQIERLEIPSVYMTDGPHGVRKVKGKDHLGKTLSEKATCFPTASALACSWNTELMYNIGQTLAEECNTFDVDILLGPGINMKRSPLGGRNFEYFSEDSLLTGKLACSLIKGLQDCGVGACVKHYACNNSEYRRMSISSEVDERTLRETYLSAFEMVVKDAKPFSIMSAYNKVNGEYASESKKLLTDILRKEWGYEGIVLSDWGAVNNIVDSIKAGLNLEMPANDGLSVEKIVKAIDNGDLDIKILDNNIKTLLKTILKINNIKKEKKDKFDIEKHHQIARQAAEESIVLLKNNNNILPLNKDKLNTISIIGKFAKNSKFQGGGSSKVYPTKIDNAYETIAKMLGNNVDIKYADGYSDDDVINQCIINEAKEKARSSEVAIIFVGLPDRFESEGYDRVHMNLPQSHICLINEILKVQKNVVVVLNNGSPITMNPWYNKVDGVIEGWLCGQASGTAIANVIFGKVNPSGKLSETFPKRLCDNPTIINAPSEENKIYYGERMFIGYKYYDYKGLEPCYCFGHGLSYTKFVYSDIKVNNENINDTDELIVTLNVKNIGKYEGKETVQLYVSDSDSSVVRPIKELKHFCKINLLPGEQKEVIFKLNKRDFSFYDAINGAWVTETGMFIIMVGSSSNDIRLIKEVFVKSTDKIIPKLNKLSFLSEWLNHPKGKLLAEEMLKKYKGFGMDNKSFEELDPFVQKIMLEMPMLKLVGFSKRSFTEEELEKMLSEI